MYKLLIKVSVQHFNSVAEISCFGVWRHTLRSGSEERLNSVGNDQKENFLKVFIMKK